MNFNDPIALIASKVTNVDVRVRWMSKLGLKKADLVAAATLRGLDTRGNRSAVAYRLARAS